MDISNIIYKSIIVSFYIIALTFVVTISILALNWIYNLEKIKCKCSKDWKRDFIKYYIYIYLVFIIVSVISFFIILVYPKIITSVYMKVFSIIKNVVGLLTLINIVISIIYIYNLKKENCICSEDIAREIYYIWNIISASVNLFVIFLFILFFIIMGIFLAFAKSKL